MKCWYCDSSNVRKFNQVENTLKCMDCGSIFGNVIEGDTE